MATNNRQPIDTTIRAPISCDVLSQAFDTSILYEAVKAPEGISKDEWAAHKVMDLFKDAQMAWGFVSSVCHCPLMRAHFMVFKWQEDPKKAAMPLPATVYIKSLFLWVDSQISDTKIFPLKPGKFKFNLETLFLLTFLYQGVPFADDFQLIVKNLLRRLFRVYSHIYCHHWPHVESISAAAHVNYCLKHFVYTVLLNKLLECNELKPLEELASYIMEEGESFGRNSVGLANKIQEKNSNGECQKSQVNPILVRTYISSPETHIPSTNSLTADSPISEDRIEISHTVPNSGEDPPITKSIKPNIPSYQQAITKAQAVGRVQSTCSDSMLITTSKSDADKKDNSIHSRKIKTYPWTEFAKKLILCTKRKKKDGKLFSSGFLTPKATSENL
ncbi:uncharacterized protein cubi_01497 [Cryptosporidium ubiquitum]|uniref:Mob1/phocein family protein n=1 Tax=Cryptosporidium ubiquitum TaxID=857276 RepID=A0A1J4MGL7_9CRYT|nr:uncharacterized protein cubi_01497 [Cryptosporidium ubiquitum]OII72164.1 hypothetical protein cubi_01497 [Cryptosporidium ubiquitum]